MIEIDVRMLEAMDHITNEIGNLSKLLKCENNIWFWDTVQSIVKEKKWQGCNRIYAFIKIKKAFLVIHEQYVKYKKQ